MKLLLIFLIGVTLANSQTALSSCEKYQDLLSRLVNRGPSTVAFVNHLWAFSEMLLKPTNQSYLGCFQDYYRQRMFRGYNKIDGVNMTNKLCIQMCKENGFVYAGTQNGYLQRF